MSQTIGLIFAHPDDETFMCACLIRQAANLGHTPVLLLATRGDAGKKNGLVSHLSNEELANLREQEMDKAAQILGLSVIEHLGYPDGKLNSVDSGVFLEKVIAFINLHQPQVIVTFPVDGGNGHPDHIAISQVTTKAVLSGRCPSVNKLYFTMTNTLIEQGHVASYTIDTEAHWGMKAEALRAHASQIYAIERYFGDLNTFPENRRSESFVLGWERGILWPEQGDKSIFKGE